jgi:ApaG protein
MTKTAQTVRAKTSAPETYEARRERLPVNPDIRVTIEPKFLPEYSAPRDKLFTFGYKITIINTGSKPLQLRQRNWLITPSAGNPLHATGPTIAGQEIIQLPARSEEAFSYESAVPFEQASGNNINGFFFSADFRTHEVGCDLNASESDLAACRDNRADEATFARRAHFADLKILHGVIGDYSRKGLLDTRGLAIDPETLLEFERLLLRRILIRYERDNVSLSGIQRDWPDYLPVWDIAVVRMRPEEKRGIQILERPQQPRPNPKAEQSDSWNVVPLRGSKLPDATKHTVEHCSNSAHNNGIMEITLKINDVAPDSLETRLKLANSIFTASAKELAKVERVLDPEAGLRALERVRRRRYRAKKAAQESGNTDAPQPPQNIAPNAKARALVPAHG